MRLEAGVSDRRDLLARVVVEPGVAGGKACIRGTRICVATILDGLAEGLSPEQLIDHFPQLTLEDVRVALAYGGALAQENTWKLVV